MSNYRQFQSGPSAEARQDKAFIRKATKDREREAYERAEANRRDARLPDDFSWERKRKVPEHEEADQHEGRGVEDREIDGPGAGAVAGVGE